MESKKRNILTILLIIVIVIVFGVIGFLGYEIIDEKKIEQEVREMADSFDKAVPTITEEELQEQIAAEMAAAQEAAGQGEGSEGGGYQEGGQEGQEGQGGQEGGNYSGGGYTGGYYSGGTYYRNSSYYTQGVYIQGHWVLGTIRIPSTGIKYPIYTSPSKEALDKGVGLVYTSNGVNQPGNTVIAGHNYKNRMFFSKNKDLGPGNKIYIKDATGVERRYSVYKSFVTTSTDASFYQRDTKGGREITLSTCTDDGTKTGKRLIVLAYEV